MTLLGIVKLVASTSKCRLRSAQWALRSSARHTPPSDRIAIVAEHRHVPQAAQHALNGVEDACGRGVFKTAAHISPRSGAAWVSSAKSSSGEVW